MAWKIHFYETTSGKSPVKKFLDALQPKAKQKILAYINLLKENGTRLPSNYLEKVEGEIKALRPEYGGNEYRIFFCITGEQEIMILHAIFKNTRRIPPSDIAIAERRMNDLTKKEKK
jgi:phage-related protein